MAKQLGTDVSPKLSAPPASPVEGQRYYDLNERKERVYTGAAWKSIPHDVPFINPMEDVPSAPAALSVPVGQPTTYFQLIPARARGRRLTGIGFIMVSKASGNDTVDVGLLSVGAGVLSRVTGGMSGSRVQRLNLQSGDGITQISAGGGAGKLSLIGIGTTPGGVLIPDSVESYVAACFGPPSGTPVQLLAQDHDRFAVMFSGEQMEPLGLAKALFQDGSSSTIPGTVPNVISPAQTISTSGTAVTVSAAPTIPLKIGGQIIAGGQQRQITAVTDTTHVTVSNAWSSDLGAGTAFTYLPPTPRYDASRPSPLLVLSFQRRILAYGDSITEGLPGTLDPRDTWPAKLQSRLGHNAYMINAGVSGNRLTTGGLLSSTRLNRDLYEARAEVVLVLAGSPDLANDGTASATVITNMGTLIQDIVDNGGIPVVLTVLPFGGMAGWSSGKETNRAAVNTWILDETSRKATWPAYESVNMETSALVDASTPTQPKIAAAYDRGDGQHLNVAGADIIAAEVFAQYFGSARQVALA